MSKNTGANTNTISNINLSHLDRFEITDDERTTEEMIKDMVTCVPTGGLMAEACMNTLPLTKRQGLANAATLVGGASLIAFAGVSATYVVPSTVAALVLGNTISNDQGQLRELASRGKDKASAQLDALLSLRNKD